MLDCPSVPSGHTALSGGSGEVTDVPDQKATGMQTREISRAEVRSATVKGFRQVKSGSSSVKLTPGQKSGITQRRSSR